ncbi:NADPH-dependent FMN reductase [Geodermatophilus ruber]|uniref:FMN reductase n=1 Tax=Geodermatophilus ruber TaxID=504800 RepID=A0A1I4AFU9_9ACTN|nr:NADPH-dependent FMN reductase [Geodermatophilus ruber]SFK55355.1 FMN reductase [Geodermatophilus ruber]
MDPATAARPGRGGDGARPLHVVGLGGTVRPGSSSEQALRTAMRRAEELGATTRAFTGAELAQLPMYAPDSGSGGPVAEELVAELRRADGVIVASPGYHGSLSGMVKNALDYTEDMREDRLPYLADRSVGLIVTAYGWQASVTTLTALRAIVHALRGWVTPYGAAINSAQCSFADGMCSDHRVLEQLHVVADEVVRFAELVSARRDPALPGLPGGRR